MVTKYKALFWLPAVLWAAGIFLLSSLQFIPDIGPEFEFKDKVGHWGMYCGLAFLVAWAMRRAHNISLGRAFWLTILVASVYGATDEWHQSFVPGRTCDVWDWASDTAGAIAAAAVFYVYWTRRHSREKRQP